MILLEELQRSTAQFGVERTTFTKALNKSVFIDAGLVRRDTKHNLLTFCTVEN